MPNEAVLRKRIFQLFLSLIILISLISCASYSWHHPQNTEYQFNMDAAECDDYAQDAKFRAADSAGGNPMAGLIMIAAYDRAFENCMYRKGYYKVTQSKEAAP